MKKIWPLGNEMKNPWGTAATNDPFIRAKAKLMHGFMRALLKFPLGRAQAIGKRPFFGRRCNF